MLYNLIANLSIPLFFIGFNGCLNSLTSNKHQAACYL